MDEPAFRSAATLARAIRQGETSSLELLELYLARVERFDRELNSVVTLAAEDARKQAAAADAALAAGQTVGPLHGVPMTVKDTFETAGLRTTAGVPELADHVPDADAEAVVRLRRAGAVVFGKTNTPTWASDWQTTNPIFGRTTTPFDASRAPGGSSGGSAAALAAGLTGLELGSDIGGSIRIPAHWSGVCGHKPSHGLVPQRGHIPGPPGSLAEADLNVVGPLARRVEDLELALDVLAGPLPDAATAWSLELPPARGVALGDFRVALFVDAAEFPVDAEMAAVIQGAAARLEQAGARIEEARPDVDFRRAVETYLDLLMPLNTRFQSEEAFQSLASLAAALPKDDPDLLLHSLRAQAATHRSWLQSQEDREAVRRRWAGFFERWDVLLCPVTLSPAIEHDERPFPERTLRVNGAERSYLEQIAWPGLITMALLPSTVVPVGRTGAGLPVGVQIVGPYLEDRTPLAFARQVEAVLGGFVAPAGFGSVGR